MDSMHLETERHLNRRTMLRLFGLTAAGTVLSACGPVAAPSAPPPPTTLPQPTSTNVPAQATVAIAPTSTTATAGKPAATDQPKTGGTLRVADMDLPKLDGHLIY